MDKEKDRDNVKMRGGDDMCGLLCLCDEGFFVA